MNVVVSRAISAIYDCALDPSLWPSTLQCIADCFDDVGALLLHRREGGSFVTIVSPSLERCAEAYAREWWRHDIRATRSMDYAYAAAAGAITDRHFITDEEIASHPIYTEFLAPFGLRWGAGLQLSPGAGAQVSLTVQRAASKPPFSDADLDLLTDLGRHAEQSLRLGLRLIDAEVAKHGLGDALSRLAVAAFVVHGDGRVSFANDRAEALIGQHFLIREGRLACRSSAVQRRFEALLEAACETVPYDRFRMLDAKPLVVSQDASPLVAYVMPALDPIEARVATAEPLCVVLAIDLARGTPLDPGLLRDIYGLTLGEARVAALVGSGIGPGAVAARLDVSQATVRTVLKRIFEKLDVTRQAELVELFTRLKVAPDPGPRRAPRMLRP